MVHQAQAGNLPAQFLRQYHARGYRRFAQHNQIDMRQMIGLYLLFDQFEQALHADGETRRRRGFAAQVLH